MGDGLEMYQQLEGRGWFWVHARNTALGEASEQIMGQKPKT